VDVWRGFIRPIQLWPKQTWISLLGKVPAVSLFTLNCEQPSVECGWRLLVDELESVEEVADLEGLLKYLPGDGSHNTPAKRVGLRVLKLILTAV